MRRDLAQEQGIRDSTQADKSAELPVLEPEPAPDGHLQGDSLQLMFPLAHPHIHQKIESGNSLHSGNSLLCNDVALVHGPELTSYGAQRVKLCKASPGHLVRYYILASIHKASACMHAIR
jgi:hypothetical protein